MTPTVTFVCSICGEPSQTICVYCTKDACVNHLCERCHRCSDCCECEVRLDEPFEHEYTVIAPEPQPVAAEPPVFEEPAAEPSEVVETVVIEDLVSVEPVAAEAPAQEEHVPLPEPEIPAVPPPLPPHPDLSKLFAPEDAPARVLPTSHGPVPISNNPPEESPEPEESSDDN